MNIQLPKWKYIVKAIVFVLLFAISYLYVSEVFSLHASSSRDIVENFYDQEEDTIDVVFLGTCHAYSSYMPLKLWDDTGITSHIFASPAQNIITSYYYYEEAMRTQNPEVIILDVYSLNRMQSYIEEEEFANLSMNAIQNLPLSFEKVKYAFDYEAEENKMNLLFGLYAYHQRWDYENDIPISKERDVKYNNTKITKGFERYWNVAPLDNPLNEIYTVQTDVVTSIDSESEMYLRKILDDAKDKDVHVILTAAPYYVKDIEMERYNYVHQIAQEYDVPFLNFNDENLINEVGLINNDMVDYYHVDYSGALKITSYLSEFLNETYDISDKREDPDYQFWNDDLETYFEFKGIEEWNQIVNHIYEPYEYDVKLTY